MTNGQKYNLNHIYYKRCHPGNLAVGQHAEYDVETIELFNKSLALTSDLKRLPILRSISVCESISRIIGANMQASAVNMSLLHIFILNERLEAAEVQTIWENALWEEHDVIYAAEVTAVQAAGILTYHQFNESGWSLLGGVLLGDQITIAIISETATNVAAAELPGIAAFDVFLEIDWQPVTKDEFEQFILENVYAKDQ